MASAFARAVAAHWQAVAHLEVAREAVTESPPPDLAASPALRAVVSDLSRCGTAVSDGWLGAALTGTVDADLGTGPPPGSPVPVRIGEAQVNDAGRFPALVPLLGGAHLAFDTDARDPQVAALLRALVIRLLGSCPAGTLRVVAIDPATLGGPFADLRPLVEAGVLAPPAVTGEDVSRALSEAEAHVHDHGDQQWLLLVAASVPDNRTDLGRLAALTHTGPAGRVCVLAAGWPEPTSYGVTPPPLGAATVVRIDGGRAFVGDPPGERFGAEGRGLAAVVAPDPAPAAPVVAGVAQALGERVRRDSALDFADLIPVELWEGSSIDGLRTVIGRAGREQVELAFDDATPHWLVGGRTGAGKTVFLLDVLYGLAARYSPDELALYLLDFKEGVSFTEFTPTVRDPSFIPHARAVGIESDREYGLAVLRELRREMNRRAATLKRYGVTRLSDLRRGGDDVAVPRIVAVIDEFQVLFERNDRLSRDAVAMLEDLARKGRSYGVHLVLASQTVSGVEALYGKNESIFGQFPMRIALPGGSGVLEAPGNAADGIPVGTAIVNSRAGISAANRPIRFPDAHADPRGVADIRHRLWEMRWPGSPPPAVFEGYATRQIEDDPTYQGLAPGGRRPLALVGRMVDVNQTTAYFAMDASPGRHLGVVGTAPVGADVLHAATLSLARQHTPDSAQFLIASLVEAADQVADETVRALESARYPVTTLDGPALRDEIRKLGDVANPPGHTRTYVVVFGMDAASAMLSQKDESFRSGLDELQSLLRNGPAYGIHFLAWWRGLRRLADDIGGTGNREDVACLVALNVPGGELALYLGQPDVSYEPRGNRALLIDRHDQRNLLLVPFVRPHRIMEEA